MLSVVVSKGSKPVAVSASDKRQVIVEMTYGDWERIVKVCVCVTLKRQESESCAVVYPCVSLTFVLLLTFNRIHHHSPRHER